VVIVVLALLLRYVAPIVVAEALFYGVIGQVVGALAIVVSWLFFSRAPWLERLGAIVLMIIAVFATQYMIHESIAKGAMGMLFYFLAIPALTFALVVWASGHPPAL
jgi:hypothetical protein